MKESNYWEQFLCTGSVEDYLKFRKKSDGGSAAAECAVTGENPYAGIHKFNRDGFEDGAYRGI